MFVSNEIQLLYGFYFYHIIKLNISFPSSIFKTRVHFGFANRINIIRTKCHDFTCIYKQLRNIKFNFL